MRDAFALWTSGVTIVAVRTGTGVHGLTVSAFAPLSLDPPMLLIALYGDAPVLSYIEEARRFVVNVLGTPQRPLASRFADRYPIAPDAFPAAGDPVLPGSRAAFVCEVDAIHAGGDHRIVTARILQTHTSPDVPALLHGERKYM